MSDSPEQELNENEQNGEGETPADVPEPQENNVEETPDNVENVEPVEVEEQQQSEEIHEKQSLEEAIEEHQAEIIPESVTPENVSLQPEEEKQEESKKDEEIKNDEESKKDDESEKDEDSQEEIMKQEDTTEAEHEPEKKIEPIDLEQQNADGEDHLPAVESEIKEPSIKTKSTKHTTKAVHSTSRAGSVMSEYLMEEEIFEESSSEATIYLESCYKMRSATCQSLLSTFPPKSWPSGGNLSIDSDVYPKESEYASEKETKQLVQSGKSIRELNRNLSKLEIEGINTPTEEIKPLLQQRSKIPAKKDEAIGNVEEDKTPDESVPESEVLETGFPFLANIFELPIDHESLQEICFSETLLISFDLYGEEEELGNVESNECKCKPVFHKSQLFESERIQEMGGMCLKIENAEYNLITFCTTQFSCMGTAGASRLISVVDNGFNLIEEKKTEWHCTHEKKIEKSLHVAKDGSGYVAFRTDTEDEEVQRHRGDVRLKLTGDLILDGGIFALMRHLILSRFAGEFETWSMHITGEMCRCKFTVGKKKMLYINDQPYMTIRIKKELFRLKRYPDISKTYFLPTGYIVRHRWKGCRYFFHLNPFGCIPPSPIAYRENQWKDDIVLISKYLDEKQKRRSEIQTYIGDNPEIKSILQDYTLCLLQLKPENVLDFTMEYFTNLFRQ